VNRHEDYMINRLEQEVNLGETIDQELGVNSIPGVRRPFLHMNIEEDDLACAIRAAGRRLAHVRPY
jgi:hypothetical protein